MTAHLSHIEGAFAEAIREAGLRPPLGIIADGDIHRFPTSDRRDDAAG